MPITVVLVALTFAICVAAIVAHALIVKSEIRQDLIEWLKARRRS